LLVKHEVRCLSISAQTRRARVWWVLSPPEETRKYQESQDQRDQRKGQDLYCCGGGRQSVPFTFQKLEGLKVGAVVDITYTGTLGGPRPVMASNLNLSKSNWQALPAEGGFP
jgi:hypothetical protein